MPTLMAESTQISFKSFHGGTLTQRTVGKRFCSAETWLDSDYSIWIYGLRNFYSALGVFVEYHALVSSKVYLCCHYIYDLLDR